MTDRFSFAQHDQDVTHAGDPKTDEIFFDLLIFDQCI
jgi:hypothetical protein